MLYGGDDDDLLRGQSGWDTMDGNGGADKLWGGAGNDTLTSRSGDVVWGEGHNDTINCWGGDCIGGEGNDSIDAENAYSAPVRLHGGPGDDSLYGSRWISTVMYGGVGYDRLVGGSHPEVICENGRLTATTFFPSPTYPGPDYQYIEGGTSDGDMVDFRDAGYNHEVWGNLDIDDLNTDVVPGFNYAALQSDQFTWQAGPENASCALLRAEYGLW